MTGASVPATELDVGEVWTVRVTPNDGYIDGSYAEESITISNSDPTISSVTISSSDGAVTYNDSTLTCTATASDPDEVVAPTYTWDVGGTIVTGSSITLSNYVLLPGNSVTLLLRSMILMVDLHLLTLRKRLIIVFPRLTR